MSILVVGSIVLDFVAVADRLPKVNETVLTDDFTIAPGGKGANQALAANRFGSGVILVSRIGTDIFSEIAMKFLKQSNLNIDHVRKSGTNTAIGLVQSSRQGETQILVAAGALKYFKHSDIDDSLYKESGIVLCQTELAFDEVEKVVEKAKRNDCQVILNLS